jgi:NTE family protein
LRPWLSLAIGAALLAGCAYPTRNAELTSASQQRRYDWSARAADGMPETLVVVTASGGGTRASALALSVLRTMDGIQLGRGKTLADEVDIISSVSGGSVTAAYFAMHGVRGDGGRDKGLADLERNFIRQDVMSPLLVRGLNPVGLAELSTPGRERIDLLIDYFDRKELFNNETFDFFLRNPRQPYLILNAADMVEGTPFPFTQYTLDLLCSDLGKIKISTAVAASAAFPVALSPVTLKNYSATTAPHCDPIRRPPAWVDLARRTPWHLNPGRAARGRTAAAYLEGAKAYIHLLDGGIADNLGISEPLRLLTTSDVSAAMPRAIQTGELKQIIFIMINARSFKESELDHAPDTPGMISMLMASIDAPIDRASFSTAQRVRDLFKEGLKAKARELEEKGATVLAKRYRELADRSRFLSVELDAIPDDACRQKMQSVPTSWTLSEKQVDATLEMGRALFLDNPDLDPTISMLGPHGRVGSSTAVDQVCATLPDRW